MQQTIFIYIYSVINILNNLSLNNYFCSMKSAISTCLLAITLLVGVITISVFNYADNFSENELVIEPNTSSNQLTNERQCFFSSTNTHPYAFANEQIRLTFSSQNVSVRTFSISNTSRIIYSIQLANRKFHSADSSFLLHFATKQLVGYYLYHLRKLLI